MATVQEQLEVDRLINLVRGFGWEEEKREMTTMDIIITLKKPRIVGEVETGAGPD